MTSKSKRKMWLDGPYPYLWSEVVPAEDFLASEDGTPFYNALTKCIREVTRLIEEEDRAITKFTVILRVDTLPMEDKE